MNEEVKMQEEMEVLEVVPPKINELNVEPVNPINVNQVVEPIDNSKPKNKKSNKGLFIGLIVIVLVVVLGVFGVKYFLGQYNAQKFLESNIEKITMNINKLMQDDLILLKDIYKDDIVSDINLKLVTDASSLKDYNNIELSAKSNINLDNNYVDVDATLKQSTASIKGTVILTKDKLYIDSEDIYSKMLYSDIEDNYFDIIKEYVNDDVLSVKDLKTLITNIGKYINKALNEADITTNYNGLNVTYTYEINDYNKDEVLNSLQESLNSDEIWNKLNEDEISLEDYELDNIKVVLNINIINQKIEDGLIEFDDRELVIEKINDNKYKIVEEDYDEEYIEIEVNGDNLVVSYVNDDEKLELKNVDNEFGLVLDADEVNLDLTISNGNTRTIKLKGIYEDTEFNLEMDIIEDNNSQSIDGNISILVDGENYKITFETDTKWGNSLFTKKSTNNAYNIDDLSSDDANVMLFNVLNSISKFPFYEAMNNSSYDDYLGF